MGCGWVADGSWVVARVVDGCGKLRIELRMGVGSCESDRLLLNNFN